MRARRRPATGTTARRAMAAGVVVMLLAACGTAGPAPAVDGGAGIDCAAGSIAGRGSSAQTTAMHLWIKRYQVACPEASIAYESTGSGAGVARFLAGDGDFAGSDAPLSPRDRARAVARCGGPVLHLPMVAGPIAVVHNVAGSGGLRLRPATLARIFAGTVTVWNDPAVAADNPGAVLPATPIRTVHRSDGSGTTANFTAFLAATAPAQWRAGSGSRWPARGGTAVQGSDGVAEAVARTDGAIGYVERSYADVHHLTTARVGNGAGEFAGLTDEAVALTVGGARVGDALRLDVDYATRAAGAYPIVLVTYEIVCRDGTRPAAVALLGGFLRYAAGEAGQRDAAELGYAPLPAALRARVTAAAGALT
ncbi:phosphate ABC transporter substrate-binding protein PstS [Pseudosporangium ferrugineum]|uniref:Phosphate-binding protein n=1 Tax=Pseudosporangium ferrugineum TaxID=439699 RepID=A0A2T0RX44_9ACTN|nr:phosphate ABC transporter substrate-binding protein PstS [Pseudosporangium ferrugineum]PRY25728.1 phosphate ABC transporter substrate-binding protein (PhoT family) [Pseudosporangium ferrugineum]